MTKHWKRTHSLTQYIDAAAQDDAKIPALLLAMADAVRPDDSDFADDLVEASESVLDSTTPREDADYWLREVYDWADTMRVWVA